MTDFLTQQLIGGQWRAGSSARELPVHDPFDQSLVTRFRLATAGDLDDAYAAARAAQPGWGAAPPQERYAVLERAWRWVEEHQGEITEQLVAESGSTRPKAGFEIGLVLEFLRAAAALTSQPRGALLASPDPEKENRLYYEPAGVVGVISPFNAPFFLSLRPVAFALALGNAVVLKPHERTPVIGGTLIGRMFTECGLPPGVLNVVVTDIEEIGDRFVAHPDADVIAFTGSSVTGKHVAEVAGRNLKKVVLELGGNSALLVLDDADLELAVNAAVAGRFIHSGQICMCVNRVVVAEQVYDEFLPRYLDKVAQLPVGDPRDESTVIGPLISPEQAELLERQVAEAVAHGAVTALAAKPRPAGSSLCSPVVLTEVTVDNPVARTELFGPAACVIRATDDADAVRIANATPYGLSGAVHTRDLDRGVRVARQVRTGMIHVNNWTIADESAVPFGGVGDSGYGRLNGDSSLQAFTRPVWVSVHSGTPRFPF